MAKTELIKISSKQAATDDRRGFQITTLDYNSNYLQQTYIQTFRHCITLSLQGIINCKGTGAFAKEPNLAKTITEVKADPRVVQQKKFSEFCRMCVMANLLWFGCFSAG